MVFGVSYEVVGRADCPYFARSDRLAQMVKQAMAASERDIKVQAIHPDAWPAHYASLCDRYGFQSFAASQLSSNAPDHVLVFHPHTKRLIGGEKAFRKEVLKKYNIECDVSWALLQSIARENVNRYSDLAAASSARQLAQPLAVVVAGQPASGRSTLSKRLEKQYGLVRVSSGDLLRRTLQGNASSSLPSLSAAELDQVRSAFSSGEFVPDEIVNKLVRARLLDADVQRSSGVVLDGYPRTEAQANALRDLEATFGRVQAFLRLASLPSHVLQERVEGRRIDPVTDEIYHTQHVLPDSALIMSRLIRRVGDYAGDANTCAIQLRAYEQSKSHVARLFKAVLIDLPSEGTRDEVLSRAVAAIDPLAAKVASNRAAAADAQARDPKHALGVRPPSPTPVASPVSQSPTLTPASPSVESIAASVVAQPLSRRSSQNAATTLASSSSASKLISSSSSKPSSRAGSRTGSRAASRRTSANAPLPIDPKSLHTSAAAAAVSSVVAASASKPGSRRTSATSAGASPIAVEQRVPLAAAPGSRRTSLNRRSSRASGTSPIVPSSTLSSVAAPAKETVSAAAGSKPGSKRSSGVTPTVPQTEKRTSSDKPIVVSRPISATSKRGSRDAPIAAAAAAAEAAAVAAPAPTEEEVVLHRKSSKRQSAVGSASTSPKEEAEAAIAEPVVAPAAAEIPAAAAEEAEPEAQAAEVEETTAEATNEAEVDAEAGAEAEGEASAEAEAEAEAEEAAAEEAAEAEAAEEATEEAAEDEAGGAEEPAGEENGAEDEAEDAGEAEEGEEAEGEEGDAEAEQGEEAEEPEEEGEE